MDGKTKKSLVVCAANYEKLFSIPATELKKVTNDEHPRIGTVKHAILRDADAARQNYNAQINSWLYDTTNIVNQHSAHLAPEIDISLGAYLLNNLSDNPTCPRNWRIVAPVQIHLDKCLPVLIATGVARRYDENNDYGSLVDTPLVKGPKWDEAFSQAYSSPPKASRKPHTVVGPQPKPISLAHVEQRPPKSVLQNFFHFLKKTTRRS